MRRVLFLGFCALLVMSIAPAYTHAQANSVQPICPAVGIQPRPAEFKPGGIILTTFDKSAIWVYNIDRNSRYPLPETSPCGANCRLSPDARWLSYYNPATNMFNKMRLDGTQRTPLARGASDVQWWTPDTLLIWTPSHDAYLRPEADEFAREDIPAKGAISIQPGGFWGVVLEQQGEDFRRVLVNLEERENPDATRAYLGYDEPYFNAASWSPDGSALAYVSRGALDPAVQVAGSEIFLIRPGSAIAQQMTYLTSTYGAVRINGHTLSDLAWSPDGTKVAFWVIELLGPNVEANTGQATIHILDVETATVSSYCGFATDEHTPNPPRLAWSPDSSHIAFGGNVPGDDKGYLLLALNVETGVFTELSDGIFPALGRPDIMAWGLP